MSLLKNLSTEEDIKQEKDSVGGGSFGPVESDIYKTKIDHAYEADAYFPDLDSDPEWEITADSDEQVYFDITYQFLKYERKKA